jgi:hypothetical protein
LIHPLMAVFVGTYAAILLALKHRRRNEHSGVILAGFSQKFFPPVTPEYREILRTRSYFFLNNWTWYEWLGLLAPFAILAWFAKIARRYALGPMNIACRALVIFGAIFFGFALVISWQGHFENLAEIQPLRYLHLYYIFMFLFIGGVLGKFILKKHVWRWAILFLPLCAEMAYAQHELAPASPHLELPGRASPNPWVQAFEWIRGNTPDVAARRGSARFSRHRPAQHAGRCRERQRRGKHVSGAVGKMEGAKYCATGLEEIYPRGFSAAQGAVRGELGGAGAPRRFRLGLPLRQRITSRLPYRVKSFSSSL